MQVETLEAQPLVLDRIWAEGEDAGAGLLDLGDAGDTGGAAGEGDAGTGAGELEGQETEGQQQTEAEEKIDGRRGSKEFREALKAWEATPEGAKFAKQARADHFRMQELAAVEPGGITALRDKYALLESVGGAEAITQMQERIAEVDQTDQLIASGDPKGLEALGPDFDPGLAKLMPSILDRVLKADPEAYSAAILPHLMNGLVNSPLVGDLNGMIDVLKAPHLDADGKIKALTGLLGRIGQWFEANEKKAGQLKAAPVDKGRQELETQRTEFEKQQQEAHWSNKIIPQAAAAERTRFTELLKPYEKLGLTEDEKTAALKTFRGKLKELCLADKDYVRTRDNYRKQKNPDPAKVVNFVKANLGKKAQAAFDAMRAEPPWNRLFAGMKKAATVTTQTGARAATGGAGTVPVVVSVKPSPDEIDYSKTSEQDQWKGLYTLKSGKKVQWRRPA